MRTAFGAMVTGVVASSSEPSRSVLDIALAEFNRMRHLRLTPTTVGVAVSQTIPCATSGTIFASGTGTDPNAQNPTAGDTLTLTYNSCVENGTTQTGSISFSINTFSGGIADPMGNQMGTVASPLNISFTMNFANLSHLDNTTNVKLSLNGDIALVTQSTGDVTTGTMSGNSFSIATTGPSANGFAMSSYALTFSRTTSTGAYSDGTTMTTASTLANGSVKITTPTELSRPNFGNPTAGVMVIAGANNSTLTLTALSDGMTVTRVLDVDGAAGPTAPVNLADTTWSAL